MAEIKKISQEELQDISANTGFKPSVIAKDLWSRITH